MKQRTVAELIEVLELERKCSDRLIEISKKEQKQLLVGKAEEISACAREMQMVVKELEGYHRRRRALLDRLAEELHLASSSPSLSTVVAGLDRYQASLLREKINKLMTTSEILYRLNQHTIYLIKFCLDLNEQQALLWVEALCPSAGYDEKGEAKKEGGRAGILEGKA